MLDPLPATDRESGAGVDTPAPDADSSASQDASCFHCGLPVAASSAPPSLEVLGVQRYFCCPGCHAVCKAIVDTGLEDYYRHRTESAVSAARPVVPEFLEQLVPTNNLIRCQCSETGPRNDEVNKKDKSAGRA